MTESVEEALSRESSSLAGFQLEEKDLSLASVSDLIGVSPGDAAIGQPGAVASRLQGQRFQ